MEDESSTNNPVILIVEDAEITRKTLERKLRGAGFECIQAGDGHEALEVLGKKRIDLVLSDQMMPRMDGLELLREVKSRYEGVPFILLTSHGSVDAAVASMKQGADDYLQKPYDPDALIAAIRRSLNYQRLTSENKKLREHLAGQYSFQNIRTDSAAMRDALRLAERISKVRQASTAIYGENGVGKEVLARAIHFAGDGAANRFVAVNCAGIPSNLLESELFGHVKGAFTGADKDREGKLDRAKQGTILLDEIGDMPLELQAKLLRVIQERVYEPVGSNVSRRADVRIIVTTHRNLPQLVKEGRFREDLYHRVNSFPITIPPLRKRKEDIPILVELFLENLRKELGKDVAGISKNALEALQAHDWPGNVRELKNCIARAAILLDEGPIRRNHLILGAGMPAEASPGAGENDIRLEFKFSRDEFSLDAVVDKTMEAILKQCGDNLTRAAELLKVDRKRFYRRDKKSPD